MSSLQSIMNMDEDQQDASTRANNKGSGTPAPESREHDPSSSSTPSSHDIHSGLQPTEKYQQQQQQLIYQQHQHQGRQHQEEKGEEEAIRSSQQFNETDLSSSSTVQQGKRRIITREPRASKSTAASSLTSTSTRPASSRRRSTASIESMDQHGYGSGASPASIGGPSGSGVGGGMPPNYPMRPMGSPNPGEVTVRLTPITGRVSRAKKGVPVHTCELCNPPKTFTRAEHLRRHQLSHQTPRYPCTYPGCERAFHRSDLLTRHQQRHDQESDKASGGGDDISRRTSTASGVSASLEDRMVGARVGMFSGLQPPPAFVSSPSGPGGASTPGSASGMPPSTPGMEYASYSPARSAAGQTMSPQMDGSGGGGDQHQYSSPSGHHRGSHSYGGYELTSTIPTIQHPNRVGLAPETLNFSDIDYQAPRTNPDSLFVVTRNLSPTTALHMDNPPELTLATDYSPWTSASESNYSTPSDMSHTRRNFMRHRSPAPLDWTGSNTLLSPFPTSTQRDIQIGSSSLEPMAAPYYMGSPFPMNPQLTSPPHHTYSQLMMDSLDDQTHEFDPSAHHHHRSSSVRSLPSSVPASAQSTETLVSPAPLPLRADMMATLGRQKETVLEGGVDISPSWGSSSPGSSGILTASSMAGLGGCGIGGITLVTPLPRNVRNAIPSYLEAYWKCFHSLYPFIHRGSVEGAREDMLRCAMAAIATQFHGSKEDRIRGFQLHEFAWQEAKRQPHLTIPVMQTILLCELFARFRGRRAVVRPSKLFESVYSRVSDSQSLVVSSSSFSDSAFYPVPVSLSESASIPSSLSSSSFSLYTPTSFAWSPSEPPSASPHGDGMDLSLAFEDFSFDHRNQGSLFSPSVSFSPSTVMNSSSPFVFDAPFHFSDYSSAPMEQSYSDNLFSQVLDQNPIVCDQAHTGSTQHSMGNVSSNQNTMTLTERWKNWQDAEARRRLLLCCFLIDSHTSVYHEQLRARDDVHHSRITLTGPSERLWAANSAEEWAAILDADPSAGEPHYIPDPESLTSHDVARHTIFDQCAILNAQVMRLPRNNRNASIIANQQSGNTGTETSHSVEKRISNLFSASAISAISNTFLALHHTPLHELLAVSGDSWVFSQKVLEQTTFVEYQRRLKLWTEQRPINHNNNNTSSSGSSSISAASTGGNSMSVTKATIYASRALLAFLNRPTEENGLTPIVACVSDYWAMYTCALIVWAFGHRATRSSNSNSTSNGDSSSSSSSNNNHRGGNGGEEQTVDWLRTVSELERPEDLIRVRGRREASIGVVGLVKRMLEADCGSSPRARLYVDAVGVLRKLEEGGNWKRF